jgi:hypothetical protein
MESLRVDGLRDDMKATLAHTAMSFHGVGYRLADGHHSRGGDHRRLEHLPPDTGADEIVEFQNDGTMRQPAAQRRVQMAPQTVGVDHVHLPRSPGNKERPSERSAQLSSECPGARTTSGVVPESLVGRKLQFDVGQTRRSPCLDKFAVTRRTERQLDSPSLEWTSQTEDAPLGPPHDS